MYLVIGGSYQGKLDWALREFALAREQVADGAALDWQGGLAAAVSGAAVLDDLEVLLARMQQAGLAQQEIMAQMAGLPEDMVVICDEVGGGLVPLDAVGREYREIVGRVCCELAARARGVVRIYCGLPQVLKQEAGV